ncbi:VWA domain-containing protein [Paenibacillus sp. 1011MAR3C5]|uniref:vWA domain-containing protein n=1 Tax=Paenibacillus sp. 1011MAR3C5 TaxID=1675787 RepID=UPI000E6CC579|nr:vWA domain-containing protein [Paenibacillus sp. 1011MAR3C5]RJE89639.1 VWA domain-containing protein [Paenibacillus sp. 1011MAR3C5]
MQRKINMLLLLFSLIGAAVGFAIGEVVLRALPETWPSYVIIGVYFGILALSVGLFCLIAELMSPSLNGHSWRQRYTDLSWKLLVPATLVLLFVVGGALQFVYGLEFGGTKKIRDIVLVIDNSGSMTETDPNNDRYKAAKSLIAEMDKDKRVAIVSFANSAQLIQPMVNVGASSQKSAVYDVIDAIEPTEEGTNFYSALTEALRVIQADRGTMVIFMSDGFSDSNITEQMDQFRSKGIALHTIGLKIGYDQGTLLLRDMAESTGGTYYDVEQSDGLSTAFRSIYLTIDNRSLLSINPNALEEPTIYKGIRLLSFVLIGLALGIGLGIMFDNRFLALSFGAGGVVGGLTSGLILNAGLSGDAFTDGLFRFIALLVLAAVIAVFTLVIPIGEKTNARRGRENAAASPREGSGRSRNSRSSGF